MPSSPGASAKNNSTVEIHATTTVGGPATRLTASSSVMITMMCTTCHGYTYPESGTRSHTHGITSADTAETAHPSAGLARTRMNGHAASAAMIGCIGYET